MYENEEEQKQKFDYFEEVDYREKRADILIVLKL